MNPFPDAIEGKTFFPKSNADTNYNCVSWAVHFKGQPIWPDERAQNAWPDDVLPRDETLQNFQSFFGMMGFSVCQPHESLAGFEKIVIYARNGLVAHVARLLPSGRWTSKMSANIDAEHLSPENLCCAGFWQVALYMHRRWTGGPPQLPNLNPPPPLIIRPG